MRFFKEPKNDERLLWTKHSKEKMRFYNLSENRLRRLLSSPKRIEKGIAPNTIAIMQPAGTKKHPTEIWLMYQIVKSKGNLPASATPARHADASRAGWPKALQAGNQKSKIKIITAWRYPAISPIGEEAPIPKDILSELKKQF